MLLGVAFVGSWPRWTYEATTGIDGSWIAGLHLARQLNLDHGREFVFTYGPLGFVAVPVAWDFTSVLLSFAYASIGLACLLAVPYLVLRRSFDDVLAAAIAAVVILVAPIDGFLPELVSLGLVAFALAILQDVVRVRTPVAAAVLGAAAGAQCLIKISAGAIALVACAVIVLAAERPDRLKALAAAAGSFAVTISTLWFAAGQDVRDVSGWVRYSFELSAGYSDAMSLYIADVRYELVLAAVLTALLVLYFARYVRLSSGRAGSVVLIGVAAMLGFLLAKEGFVRHDVHSQLYFFSVAFAAISVRASRAGRPLFAVVVGLAVCATSLVASTTILANVDPSKSVRALAGGMLVVVSPGDRQRISDGAAASARASYDVPDAILGRIGAKTVSVDPWETTLAWAYGLNWRPVPVFQRYSAYTQALDELNARALDGPDAPQAVLRERTVGLDGRNDLWDSPRSMLALVCGWREAVASDRWQLLERERSRCGSRRRLSTTDVRRGDEVDVPQAGSRELVVAEIAVEKSLRERLRAFLFKPDEPLTVTADGVGYRVAGPEVAAPLVLRAPPLDWSPQFGGGTSTDRISVNRDATVSFYRIPFSADS